MTPQDPQPFPASEYEIPPEPRNGAFWSWLDVVMFVAFAFLSLLIAMAATALLHMSHLFAQATELVLAQCILYVLIIGALYIIIRSRYRRPFWPAMGFGPARPHWITYAVAGMFLAVFIGLLGVALKAPEIPLPFQDMLRSRGAIISLGVLVVALGPFCEELVFRGFLMPILMRTLGIAAGIILAGVLFGALHGPEYHWAWQQIVLISTVGVVFGWARYRTGSNIPAFLMHAGFNLTQFVALIYSNTK
ncbi:MAG TPA: type II CAAX endopeptidase family protein [Bryobacteraceae bacterium]|nr:type II CAAX endopeptidase family protein [Bryobacteraceae bacterium]